MLVIDYKKLEIYELAHKFVLRIYDVCRVFPKDEDNNLTSQLRRAASCLPLNIAEGSGAGSYRVFLNYCVFCYRSCMECEAALRICRDLSYLSVEKHDEVWAELDLFIRKLYCFMEYLDKRSKRGFYYSQHKHYIDKDMESRSV